MKHIHTRSRFTLAMIGLTAAACLTLPAGVQGELLDDFSDGDDVGWTHWTRPPDLAGASWDARTFVYRLSVRGSAPANALVGAHLDITEDPSYWNGYWWATVVREYANTHDGLVMRGDVEAVNGYYFGWCSNAGGLIIQRVDNGIPRTLANSPPFVQEVGREYIMEAGAIGSDLELRMWPLGDDRPELPQVAVTDSTYSWGVNGIAAKANSNGALSATFDDVSFVPEPIPGDLDGDGDVDLSDLAQLLANYGMTEGATYEDGDLDGDGDVDLSDLAELLANYGTGP